MCSGVKCRKEGERKVNNERVFYALSCSDKLIAIVCLYIYFGQVRKNVVKVIQPQSSDSMIKDTTNNQEYLALSKISILQINKITHPLELRSG